MAKKKAAKRRRGKIVEKDGAPAHEAGDAVRGAFDPAEVAEKANIFWLDGEARSFYLGEGKNGSTRWSKWPENKLSRLIHAGSLTDGTVVRMQKREGEFLSELEQVFLHTMQQRRIDAVMPSLAGYHCGIHELGAKRILVKSSPQIISPRKGDWPVIRATVESRLKLEDVDQTPWFWSWCKCALESLVDGGPGNFKKGHALILAGPAGSAKSRLQHQIITGLLGGRSGDPSKYLMGRDEYNGELFEAEHLLMEELPTPSQKTHDRTALAQEFKRIVANDTARMRLMRTEPVTVAPFWRLSITINDDPDAMRSLPLLTPDFRDKVLMLLVQRCPLPMPTATIAEQRAFRESIKAEMPAFAHWLLHEWSVPEELTVYDDGRDASRFGFREFQHPRLAGELHDDTPAAKFLALIDEARFAHRGEMVPLWELPSCSEQVGLYWEDSALALERLMLTEEPKKESLLEPVTWCSVAKQTAAWVRNNSADRSLARLHEDCPDRIERHRTRNARRWRIYKPVGGSEE